VTTEIRKGSNRGGKRSLTPFYVVLGLIVFIGGGLLAMSMLRKDAPVTEPSAAASAPITPSELVSKAKGVVRGSNTAPVKILVFSDYMCPWCALYATTIENQVKSTFVDSGRVVEVYHDFPLGGAAHRYGFLVARAARCAGDQNRFWEYHDLVFQKQREWAASKVEPVKELVGYAGVVGADKAAFEGCLRSDSHADVVEWNRQLGMSLGVNSTPTVFINSRRAVSPMDWEKFKLEIETALGAGR
jgi:protein-disulfide isomerase